MKTASYGVGVPLGSREYSETDIARVIIRLNLVLSCATKRVQEAVIREVK